MTFKSLQHCGLVVRDLERSRWFYGKVLGMVELPRPKTFTFEGAWFKGGAGELHLIVAKDTTAPAGFQDAGPSKHTGLATHLAFEVDDLAEIKARLAEHGVEITGGPIMRGDGVEQMYVLDPDGFMVEFFQWTNESQDQAPERRPVRGDEDR